MTSGAKMRSFPLPLKYLLALATISITTAAHADFSDVPPTHPYKGAITWTQGVGIVDGYSDGTFRPDLTINRAEFVKIVIEATYEDDNIASCLHNIDALFSDIPIQSWVAPYVCLAWKGDIV